MFCTTISSQDAFADTAPPAFVVNGNVSSPHTWTVSELQKQFGARLKPLAYTLKGTPHQADVIPLEALIDAAAPRINPHIKHGLLMATVTVTGRDGYTVVFSIGELSPQFGNEAAWVAIDQDGKPLDSDNGPVELILPNDQKAGRWVHAVESVTIKTSQD